MAFAYKTLLSALIYLFFTTANTLVTKALKETHINLDQNGNPTSSSHSQSPDGSGGFVEIPNKTRKFSHDILFVNIMVFAEGLLTLWFLAVWFGFTHQEDREWEEWEEALECAEGDMQLDPMPLLIQQEDNDEDDERKPMLQLKTEPAPSYADGRKDAVALSLKDGEIRYHRDTGKPLQKRRSPFSPLPLIPFALSGALDWLATLLQVMGQGYVAASAYQMLKTSRLVFVWMVSAVFVCIGVSKKAVLTREMVWKKRLGLVATVAGVLLVSWGIVQLEADCKTLKELKEKQKKIELEKIEKAKIDAGLGGVAAGLGDEGNLGALDAKIKRKVGGKTDSGHELASSDVGGAVAGGESEHELSFAELAASVVAQVKQDLGGVAALPVRSRWWNPEEHEEHGEGFQVDGSQHPPEHPEQKHNTSLSTSGLSSALQGGKKGKDTTPDENKKSSKSPDKPNTDEKNKKDNGGNTGSKEGSCDPNTNLNKDKKEEALLGIGLITAGVFCSALRLASQEAFLKRAKHVPPTLAVGVEGIFGLIVGILVVIIFNSEANGSGDQSQNQNQNSLSNTFKIKPSVFWEDLKHSTRAQLLIVLIAFVAIGHNLYGALFAVHTSSAGRTIFKNSCVATLLIFNIENVFENLWSVTPLEHKYNVEKNHFWYLTGGYILTTLGTLWFFHIWIPLPWKCCGKGCPGNTEIGDDEEEGDDEILGGHGEAVRKPEIVENGAALV